MDELLLTNLDLPKTSHILLRHHILFQSRLELTHILYVDTTSRGFLFFVTFYSLVSPSLRLYQLHRLDLGSLLSE
jgi:hypothetical protein